MIAWLGFVLVAALGTLAVAASFVRRVSSADAGTLDMQRIASAIREGAQAFLRRQYRTVALFAVAVALLVAAVGFLVSGPSAAFRTATAFLVGAVCSGAAGWFAMYVSLRSNVRVANAARTSLAAALAMAIRAGSAAAFVIMSSSLLGVTVLFLAFGGLGSPSTVPHTLVGFAFGASFVALFGQLGGGIYTKAADVGADLVGKLEAGIPEDDPRNPAVIADLVGDNVGDCAGRGADLFESAAAENIGAMILGVAVFSRFGVAGVLFPLVTSAFGLVASVFGVLAARTRGDEGDPMSAMTRGYLVTMLLAAVGLWVAVRFLLGAGVWLFAAALIGLLASFVFASLARYYTSARHRAVRTVAESSSSGSASNVIAGFAIALESTALPVLSLSLALVGAYVCGSRAMPGVPGAGLYGTAVATMGMLSTVAYVLSIDIFGPITDNAGGIIEMSGQPAEVRERTDGLDAAGNTTKALTKGYAIGSATLAAFLLFSAYLDRVTLLGRERLRAIGDPAWASYRFEHVDIGKLPVFIAALVGATVVFLFSAFAIKAVVRDAHAVIDEVRRQLREHPGILTRGEKPEFGRCVDIGTKGALRGMIAPALIAVSAPVVVGVAFRLGAPRADAALGAECVAATLMIGTIAGVLLALTMNTGGGTWDNAKKLIEHGAFGGKGSEAHRAAVVGDAVGDPLKDTAGPSLHVLVKLFGTVALVAAPLFL